MSNPAADRCLVSVIVPVFQGEADLDECVQSITVQTHADLDVILVDDGSTDASPGICDGWAARDPRIRVIHGENGGLSVARNRGLDVMKGRFVTFIDADDVVAPNYVADLLEARGSARADLVLADLVPFRVPGMPPAFRGPSRARTFPAQDVLADIVRTGIGFASCGKLIAADLFATLRFRPQSDFEDLEILPRLFAEASTVTVSDAAQYGYRQHEGSLMDGHRRFLRPSLLHVLDSNIEFIRAGEPDELRRQELTVGFVMHGMRTLESGARSGVARAPGYDTQYRRFIRTHLRTLLASAHVSLPYKVATLVSLVSPSLFLRAVRLASGVKATVAPNLRRRPN
ncbi:MAG: glycosyltransferase [Knoellia sp.]